MVFLYIIYAIFERSLVFMFKMLVHVKFLLKKQINYNNITVNAIFSEKVVISRDT